MSKIEEIPSEISENDLHAINESFNEELGYFKKAEMMVEKEPNE